MEDKDETKEEVTKPEGDGEGIQSSTVSELDRADQIAERQKRENDRKEELLEREEKLEARRAVGGRSVGHQETPEPKKQTDEEFTEEFEKGKVDLLAQ